jgi:hypothetical protein
MARVSIIFSLILFLVGVFVLVLLVLSKTTFSGQLSHVKGTVTDSSIVKGIGQLFATSTDSAETNIATTTPESAATSTEALEDIKKPVYSYNTYIEIKDGCGAYFDGDCVVVRSGPGTEYEKIDSVRNGVILRVADTTEDKTGRVWYKVTFSNEWIRYPERRKGNWYIAGDFVRVLPNTESSYTDGAIPNTDKKIIVDRGDQMIYAYENNVLFMEQVVSTGKLGYDTPRGTFQIFRKMPSRYMQGPLPGISSQVYDLPGVPWTMYFTTQGGAIHGAYWHENFGSSWSHGCVNVPLEDAERLYKWADLGTTVIVRD